jgi:hypothetical protein
MFERRWQSCILFCLGVPWVVVGDDFGEVHRSGTDTYTRDIENIPDGEIGEAVRRLLEGTYGAERENVIRQVSRLLGFSKMGSSIHDGIDSVVADMIDRGELTTDDDTLQLAATDADSDV